MLTPKQINDAPETLVELYDQVANDIIADMARRISAYDLFIPSAQWQYQKLREMGMLHGEILKRLSRVSGKSQRELRKIMTAYGEKSIKSDDEIYKSAGLKPSGVSQSQALNDILKTGIDQTQGLFENITGTTANTAAMQFERALDKAWLQVQSGAFGQTEAVRNAIKELTRGGLEVIRYPSGRVDHMDVAVRRAVTTGVNQTCAKLQMARADEMGCDLVEVTAHEGARPSHQAWQGKVYSRSGTNDKYPDFASSTGYGTGPGLCGWNCRHNFFPFFEGISEPAYTQKNLRSYGAKSVTYNGREMTEYEASQIQRGIERNIRRWKREYLAMDAAGLDTTEAAYKLQTYNARQNDFLEQTGFKQQYDRSKTEGFGRAEAARAKRVAKSWENGIIKNKEQAAIFSYISGDSYKINAKLRDGSILEPHEDDLISNLDSALRKLPEYHGEAIRSLLFTSREELQKFAIEHKIGKVVTYPAFTSASTETGYHENPSIIMKIQSETGRDLREYNKKEAEILFPRNSAFFIKSVEVDNGVITINARDVTNELDV